MPTLQPVRGRFGNDSIPSWMLKGDYREGISVLDVQGELPSNRLIRMAEKRVVTEDIFHHMEEIKSTQGVDLTAGAAIYTDTGLSSAYASGGAADAVLYVKVPAAFAKECQSGRTAVGRVKARLKSDTHGDIVDVVENGASSYVAWKLTHADNRGASSAAVIATIDRFMLKGSAFADGTGLPESTTYLSEDMSNACQIFKTSIQLTGRAMATDRRDVKAKQLWARELERKLIMHGEGIEADFWSGSYYAGSRNGKRFTKTRGFFDHMLLYAPDNWVDFRTDTDFAGLTWREGGADWLHKVLKEWSTYGVANPKAICGGYARSGLHQLAMDGGVIYLEPGDKSMGLATRRWITPDAEFDLMTSKQFNREPSDRNRIVLMNEDNIGYCPMQGRDTKFLTSKEASEEGIIDMTFGGYRTDAGFEWRLINKCLVMDGVGQDNVL